MCTPSAAGTQQHILFKYSLLEKLALCCARIPHNANVDVSAESDSLGRCLVDAAKEHEQYPCLDMWMAKNCRCHAFNKAMIQLRSVFHFQNFLLFFGRKDGINLILANFVVVSKRKIDKLQSKRFTRAFDG